MLTTAARNLSHSLEIRLFSENTHELRKHNYDDSSSSTLSIQSAVGDSCRGNLSCISPSLNTMLHWSHIDLGSILPLLYFFFILGKCATVLLRMDVFRTYGEKPEKEVVVLFPEQQRAS